MYSTIIKPSSIIAILWTKRQNRAIMVFLLIAILHDATALRCKLG